MSSVPVLIQPKLFALGNRWRTNSFFDKNVFRDATILAVGLFVMWGIYYLTVQGLRKIEENAALAYLSPSIPIGIILLMLFAMLLVSSLVSSLGIYFTSEDLELHLSAPISRGQFFFQKMLLVLFSSAWMPMVFLFPMLAAYAQIWNADPSFFLLAFALLVPYFTIPVSVAIILSTLYASFFPVGRTRELLFCAMVLLLVFIYFFIELVSFGTENHDDMGQLLSMLATLSLPDSFWVPSHWVAASLRDALEGRFSLDAPQPRLLFSVALSLVCLAFLLMISLHQRAYARAQNNRRGEKTTLLSIREWLLKRSGIGESPRFAIMFKEYASFARETTQTIQLLLLAGIFIIYLYNLRIFRILDQLPTAEADFWRTLLYVANNGMGALVTTAVCTRFVFPSISLEGRSFWMFLKGPLSLAEFVKTKFLCWYIPVGFLAAIVFASGSLALGSSGITIALNFLAGWLVSYGLVGLAIGAGGQFSNFKWEHPSQLAASFGSLTFMLLATVFIGLNLVPIGIIVASANENALLNRVPELLKFASLFSCVLVIIAVNWLATKASLHFGIRALEREKL